MQQGSFAWYELGTTDVPAARSFYEKVVGWTAADSGMADITYVLFQASGIPVAGLMEIPPHMREGGATPHWSGYVAVDDVDATTEQAKQLGGRVHRQPTDIPGVGRFSAISDPHGAMINPFKGQGEAPPPVSPRTPGQVGWRELMAGDLATAWEFYSKLFGWTKSRAIEMGGMGVYHVFASGGDDIGGMMTKPPQSPRVGWRYYVRVDGIDAAMRHVKEAGGTVLHEPVEVPGGDWVIHGVDPQGAFFALVSTSR